MKKLLLSITSLLSLAVCTTAQNSSPYWSLAGNSNATSSSKLGTTNANDLKFYTNNSERMRITSSGDVGIGITSLSAKFMVNSTTGKNPFKVQINGTSKLFVSSGGGVSVGSSSIPPSNGLYVLGNVGIGTTSPSAKLEVINSSTSGNTAIFGSGYTAVYGIGSIYGTIGKSDYIGACGGGSVYGVYGYSDNDTGTGVFGSSYLKYGGDFESNFNYGIRATTFRGSYAGGFYGNIYCSGTVYQTSDKNLKKNIQEFGDAMSIINKLKPKYYEFKNDAKYASLNLPKGNHYGLIGQDLQEILPNLVLETPHELRTVKPITAIKPTEDGSPSPRVAEQQEKKESINIKAVNYTELIPIVIKGIQEQDIKLKEQEIKISEQQKQNEDLQKQINELKTLVQSITKQGGNIPGSSAFIKQNAPNPSNNNTVISYYTPDNTRNAQILVTDMKGSVLKAYNVSRGESQLTIKNGEIPAGTYNYTLYVNSNKIDTKQMIIIK